MWGSASPDEFCLDEGMLGTVSFNQHVEYDANTVQLLFVALLSTICSMFVLYYHWTTPPHPKFLLLTKRRICIRVHVLSGSTEILTFLSAWFFPLTITQLDMLVHITLAAAICHVLTSLSQIRVLFGIRALMVPAYVSAVGVKIACVVDLYLHPLCARKFLQLYIIHSTYVFVRVFIWVLARLGLMKETRYTSAVLFAVFICFPSFGPAANAGFALVVIGYAIVVRAFGSADYGALQWHENARDMFKNSRTRGMLESLSSTACPFGAQVFASAEAADPEGMLKALFQHMDKDGNGFVTMKELEQFNAHHQAGGLKSLLEFYKTQGGEKGGAENRQGMDFATFRRVLGGKQQVVGAANEATIAYLTSAKATFEEKARFVFDAIDGSGERDNNISMEELAYVLLQFGLPIKDVKQIMRQVDHNGDGQMSFDEFQVGMAPLVNFQMMELAKSIKELNAFKHRDGHDLDYLRQSLPPPTSSPTGNQVSELAESPSSKSIKSIISV